MSGPFAFGASGFSFFSESLGLVGSTLLPSKDTDYDSSARFFLEGIASPFDLY